MEGNRTHLKPPTLCEKKVQAQVFFFFVKFQYKFSSDLNNIKIFRTKLSLNASKLMSFDYNQIKGDNEMLKYFPCT